jgi:prepilin signal peptidase PulO-like enzyme (type II secretory pathway)
MEVLIGIIIFVLGLCFGSFVNMLIYRTAERYELKVCQAYKVHQVKNKNRSFCDFCGRQLNWYENIPVFSWLILKGKTKCCHKKLPLSYPILELVMGILFLIYGMMIMLRGGGASVQFALGMLIIVLLVFSAVFDLKYMILPDFSTIILIICSFILVATRHGALPEGIIAAVVSSGFLLILNLITKGNGMGMGDVKLALFMGLFLGHPKTIIAFYVAFIVGAVFGLILMIFKKANRKSQIPFGPFMILGILVAWWWGEKVIELIRL